MTKIIPFTLALIWGCTVRCGTEQFMLMLLFSLIAWAYLVALWVMADKIYTYFIAYVIIWKHSDAWYILYPALAVTWGILTLIYLLS